MESLSNYACVFKTADRVYKTVFEIVDRVHKETIGNAEEKNTPSIGVLDVVRTLRLFSARLMIVTSPALERISM